MKNKIKEIIYIIIIFILIFIPFLYAQYLDKKDTVNTDEITTTTERSTRKTVNNKGVINDVSYEFTSKNRMDIVESCYGYKDVDGYLYYTLSLGERNTGGYSINIYDIQVDNDKNVIVFFNEVKPDPSSMVIQVITYPSVTLKFSNNVNSIKFYSNDLYEYQAC